MPWFGTHITGAGNLHNPGSDWHFNAAADFNGDGKFDILWEHDSGLPQIWTMNGTTITGATSQSWQRLAFHCGRRFQR